VVIERGLLRPEFGERREMREAALRVKARARKCKEEAVRLDQEEGVLAGVEDAVVVEGL
jgi:hypothetical protein